MSIMLTENYCVCRLPFRRVDQNSNAIEHDTNRKTIISYSVFSLRSIQKLPEEDSYLRRVKAVYYPHESSPRQHFPFLQGYRLTDVQLR